MTFRFEDKVTQGHLGWGGFWQCVGNLVNSFDEKLEKLVWEVVSGRMLKLLPSQVLKTNSKLSMETCFGF